jgi:Phosphate-selective porin O and P
MLRLPARSGHARRALFTSLLLAALSAKPEPARAQETERAAQIHGFGTESYGKTGGNNEYSVGDPKGDYDHGAMSLVVLARSGDKLSIATNVALDQTTSGFTPSLEYAFAEWRFSDAVKLRAGRVKQPFGLYTEIFDVGTLRPFVTLPQGIYGPVGFVSEGFDGVSLTGRIPSGRWAVGYDLYGGSIGFSADQARQDILNDGSVVAEGERLRDTIGGRLNLETPVTGLVVGASAYTGTEDAGRHSVVGIHAVYLSERWSVRTERAHESEDRGVKADAFYVEAARQFAKWQVAARYDLSTTSEGTAPPAAESLRHHHDASVGLNYWFAPGFVLKLSYHHVEGNRFAHPPAELISQAIRDGQLNDRTNMVVLGSQFSF